MLTESVRPSFDDPRLGPLSAKRWYGRNLAFSPAAAKLHELITIAATAGVMLDWTPGYFLGADPESVSLTKLVVLPLIAFDVLVNPSLYVGRSTRWAWAVALAIVFGVGSGVMIGTVEARRFVSLLPTAPILIFYSIARPLPQLRRIVACCFWCSILVPVCLLLVYWGFLNPSEYVREGPITRILAGTSWSSLGLYGMISSATLGGILVNARPGIVGRLLQWAAAPIIALGFGGLLVTGQRSAPTIFVATFLIAFAGYATRKSLKRAAYATVVLGGATFGLLYVAGDAIGNMSETVKYRWELTQTDPVGSGYVERQDFYRVFVRDVIWDTHVLPPGTARFIDEMGTVPHLILGEAYYEGGLVLLLALLYAFGRCAWQMRRNWALMRRAGADELQIALTALAIGGFAVVSINPGLHIRLVYLLLGICSTTPLSLGVRAAPTRAERHSTHLRF